MDDHEERAAAAAAQAIHKVNEMLATPVVLEELKMKARFRRAKYEAHVAVGFTPGQALYLCTFDL